MDITRLSTSWIVMALLVASVSICTANAVASLDQKPTVSTGTSTQSAPATPHHLGHSKDDIYIDDDATEGSGGHGGNRDDLDREPDYSGSGFGPDDEDSVTHSRNNNHNNFHNPNKHNKNTGASGSGKNSKNDEFDGSGDGGFSTTDDIRGENDDDEDNRFGHTSVKLPTTPTNSQAPTIPVHKITADDDLHIEEEDKHNEEDQDLNVDEDEEEDDVEDDEDPENTGAHDDDHIGGGVGGGVGEEDIQKPAVDPTTTDDEDLEPGTKEEDDQDTHNRGLNPYPEDKDRQNVGTGGAATGTGSTGVSGNEVLIMNTKNEDRTTSFFSQPGILAAVIGGAVVGLLCAILVVMFIVYRMRKKDEGSYALDEPKRSPAANSYAKNTNNREFYA